MLLDLLDTVKERLDQLEEEEENVNDNWSSTFESEDDSQVVDTSAGSNSDTDNSDGNQEDADDADDEENEGLSESETSDSIVETSDSGIYVSE